MISPLQLFSSRNTDTFILWQQAVIGIAGAGGLGSNIAISLARAGIGKLIIADFDTISLENLNRQQYNLDQVGQLKVSALRQNIMAFNPYISLEIHPQKIDKDNIDSIFGLADILIEAFDDASQKEMLISTWMELYPEKPIIAASGIAGYGNNHALVTQQYGKLYIIGDNASEIVPGESPIAPRVAIVANMQANLALELLG